MSKEFVINIEKFNEFLSKYFTDEARLSITYQFVTSDAVEKKEVITKEQLEQAKKDIREQGWFDDDDNCITFRQVYVGDVFDILDKLIEGGN